jgi:DNA-binding NarL/FixJ family response regulator
LIDILLVEDCQADREFIKSSIKSAFNSSVKIIEAETLKNAKLELIKPESNFDIILLDLLLPDSSGINTLSSIMDMGVDVPIIVITGIQDGGIRLKSLESGASEFIDKSKINQNSVSDCITSTLYVYKNKACIRCNITEQVKRMFDLFSGMKDQMDSVIRNDVAIDARLQQIERWVLGERSIDKSMEGAVQSIEDFRKYKKWTIATLLSAVVAIIMGVINFFMSKIMN